MTLRPIISYVFFLFSAALFFAVFFFSACIVSADSQEQSIEVKDIKFWSSKGYTRIVVDLSEPVEFLQKRLSAPDRLYFDLKNSRILKDIQTNLPVGDGILKTVRAGQFDKDTVRVVLDLEEIKDFKATVLGEPAQLIIDVYGHKRKPQKGKETFTGKVTVVIDPGHGGHDPGAVGPKGLYEKNVVLDIGLRLKKIIAKNKKINVIMTRDKDVFVPLHERTAFANTKDADIFVSIHANASPSRKARGIETYLLNWTNNEESLRVAARENSISLKKMKAETKKYKSDVDKMLSDLRRDLKRDESLKLANFVQEAMVSSLAEKYSRVNNLGVKSALFYVLFGARMPSILAEVSFINNPVEEALLKKDTYREHIAQAIANAIETYASSSPELKVAASQKTPAFQR